MTKAEFLIVTALLAILCGLLAIVLHKVRRVHLATFELFSRKDADAMFAQMQSVIALERALGFERPLPPMRGWAGSPDFLLHVATAIGEVRPRVVVECSSGVSTLVIARALQKNGLGRLYSLEHGAEYAEKTRQLLREHRLEAWATVVDAPLRTALGGTPWYSLENLPRDAAPIDMLVIDGPPQPTARMARYPALPMLLDRMAPRFVVYADDAIRADERKMVHRWADEIPGLTFDWLTAEKGLAVVRRAG